MNQDEQHLRLLSIFHYVLGGLTIAGSVLGGLAYAAMGAAMLHGGLGAGLDARNAPPPGAGMMFLAAGVAAILLGSITGILQIVAGAKLKNHTSRIFCLVIAALECLSMPLGTALGIFTIIVLVRPSVIELFEGRAPAPTQMP